MNTELLRALTKLLCAVGFVITTIALLMFSMSNATALQTPAVHLGNNPIVSFYCYSTSNTYTVPVGSDLIITDISAPDYLVVKADNVTIWAHYGNYANTSKNNSLTTGFVAPGGSVVSCPSYQGYLSGYLVKS